MQPHFIIRILHRKQELQSSDNIEGNPGNVERIVLAPGLASNKPAELLPYIQALSTDLQNNNPRAGFDSASKEQTASSHCSHPLQNQSLELPGINKARDDEQSLWELRRIREKGV